MNPPCWITRKNFSCRPVNTKSLYRFLMWLSLRDSPWSIIPSTICWRPFHQVPRWSSPDLPAVSSPMFYLTIKSRPSVPRGLPIRNCCSMLSAAGERGITCLGIVQKRSVFCLDRHKCLRIKLNNMKYKIGFSRIIITYFAFWVLLLS